MQLGFASHCPNLGLAGFSPVGPRNEVGGWHLPLLNGKGCIPWTQANGALVVVASIDDELVF
jgi:hypothetical protein